MFMSTKKYYMKFHFWLIQNIYCLDILLLFKYTMYNFYKFWERKSVYYLSCIINWFFYSVVYSLGLYCTCPVLYWTPCLLLLIQYGFSIQFLLVQYSPKLCKAMHNYPLLLWSRYLACLKWKSGIWLHW